MGVVCLPIVWIAQPNCLFVCLFLGHSNSYEELLASPRRCSSRPRKNCSSSPSSLLPLTERCPPESSRLGHNSPSSMPSSSARRPSWRTIYLTMLVVFLAFSLPTAGNAPISLSLKSFYQLVTRWWLVFQSVVIRVVARGTQTLAVLASATKYVGASRLVLNRFPFYCTTFLCFF